MNLKVSIIIPAYNAAATIEETLRSIMAQTYDDWEAIVVDDGSRDDTLQVVLAICQLDGRIRLIQQAHAGVSAARNRGLVEAVADWVLFLDADDLILERHLEHLVEKTWGEPAPDVILSGWSRVAQAGNRLKAERMMADHLTVEAIIRYCPPIHAFLVRREIVEKVGGFDSELRTCEDMDLWIRVIKTGSTFRILEEASALYRFRVDSASSGGLRLLEDGLAVLARAHRADPPVLQPTLPYAEGRPEAGLTEEAYYFLCWCAGLELGRGVDARKLLDRAPVGVCCDLESDFIAQRLFYAAALFSPQEAPDEASFWTRRIQLAEKFLTALERRSLIAGLARSSGAALEKLVIDNVVSQASFLIGKSLPLELEVTRPVYDIYTSPSVERVLCRVNLGGNEMGMLELPVIGGMVSKYVLSDAIADEFGWKILDQFLQSNVYGSLQVTETENHKIVSRHGVVLTDSIPVDSPALAPFLHERAGWALFLQEVWAQRDRPLAWFYDAAIEEKAERTEQVENDWLQIEVSEPLPDLMSDYSLLQVLVTVGGVAIGVVPITSQEGMVTAHRLRTEITRATGFELCRAAVREGLLDRPISGQGT